MTIEIVPWEEEPYDYYYDPWVAADQADKIADVSNIRISRNKQLSWIAVNEDDDVVGAVWSSITQSDEVHDTMVFDFDVAVDPKWRSGRIGLQLIERAIEDLRTHQSEFPDTYARVWVVNPRLVRVLENRYGFEIESIYRDGSAHMFFK